MNHAHDDEVEGIARELEQYALLHPTAADTAAGIARWWLARREEPSLNRVEAALEKLVEKGVLVRRLLPDGKSTYACATPLAPRRPPTS